MKLRTLIFLVMLSCTTVPLIIFHLLNITSEKQLLLNETIAKLQDVADINHKRITSLLANKKNSVALIKSRTQLRQLLKRSNRDPAQEDVARIDKIISHAISSSESIYGIAIYNHGKELVYASREGLRSLINVSDLKKDSSRYNVKILFSDQLQLLLFIEPIELDGQLIGYIEVAFKNDELRAIVSDYTGLGKSGEIVLASRDVNGDAFFLTPTRNDPTVALSLTVPKSNLEIPITHAINGTNDIFPDYVDYREVPVLAISHHIPETDWGMVVKIDKAEAFKRVEELNLQSIEVVIGALCLVSLLSFILISWITKPFLIIHEVLAKAVNEKRIAITEHHTIHEIQEVVQSLNFLLQQRNQNEEALYNSIKELTKLNHQLDSEAERFKRWKESNFIGIIHSDAKGNILDANSTLLEMIGYTQDELIDGKIDWKNLTPEKYLPLDLRAVEEANDKGYWTPFEKVYLHKSGLEVPILIGGSIFNKDSQEFIVFVVSLADKYKQMRELEQYKGIIENSSDMFAFLDLTYTFKTVNQAYLKLHGKKREEVVGHTVSDILGNTLFKKLKSKIDHAIKGNSVTFKESLFVGTPQERTLRVSYIPYHSSEKEIIGFIFKGEDITELESKQKLIELKEAEQKRIIESLLEGIFTTDSHGTILSFNPEAENIFGYQEDEIVGHNIDELTDGIDQHSAKLANYIKSGKSQIINNRLGRDVKAKHKTGYIFPIRISVASMPLTEQGELHFIANFQDMSEHEQQAKLINRSSKLESLGNIAGGVAHDFNNILGIILGYTNLISDHDKDPTSCVQAIERACYRGQKLTGNLLTFAKKNPSTPVYTDLNELIKKNKKLLEAAMTSKIRLTLELNPLISRAHIEENLFEDLLLNLSINAMHAMPNGGEFKISTQQVTLTDEQMAALELKTEKTIRVSFKDTGEGILPENIDKVFDPFFTTKKETGNGLGLSQCYGFVKASNGAIDVSSEIGIGTVFTVYFPAVIEKSANGTLTHQKQLLSLPQQIENILVVDDEEDIRFLIQSFLTGTKVNVVEASNAVDGLSILTEQSIDLVISDVIMPKIDGLEFIQAALKNNKELKYMFISGFIGNEDIEHLTTNCILYKPFNKQQLIEKIIDIFN
ncbi:PAS domain S-box protein [Pseudoalteromonas obscura]|uniref:histidine kinase n=1 Tax=Pseudoalteromonas obscura TaxID=3048491 RepID=A0ABT7EEB6_9GAMM|nr:PAS domain S-box protein [Pseudoalteromonas sp. P94(2023)]MDK2593621.1 PAS domain S-box protein [Pseudoalteromonas sp. P94(2023)]